MKKKTVLIVAVLAVVVIAAYILLTAVPVYPSQVIDAGTYAQLRQTMEKRTDAIMPEEDSLPFVPEKCVVVRDSTTLLAKTRACSVTGTEEHEGVTIHYEMEIRASMPEDERWKTVCSKFDMNDGEGPACGIDVTFSLGTQNCEMLATYPIEGADTAVIDNYLADKLLDSAELILRQAGVDAADEVQAARQEWYTPIASDPEPENTGLTEEEAAAAFYFSIDGQNLSLGIREGDYPWEYVGLPETPEHDTTGDHGEKSRSFTHGGVLVSYYTHGEGEEVGSHITSMVTSEPGPATPRGITVGDTMERMAEVYPEAVYCSFYEYGTEETIPYYDSVYIYEPGGYGYCKHIGFYVTDGYITTIEIVDMIDGRILSGI